MSTDNNDLTETPAWAVSEFAGKKLPQPDGDLTPQMPDRLQIMITDGDQHEIVDAAEKATAEFAYSRGPNLVRVSDARQLPDALVNPLGSKHKGITRADDQRAIIVCEPSYIATEITRHCEIWKPDGRTAVGKRKTNFPEGLARTLIERKVWPNIQPLDAVVRSPFVREDGTICDTAGYDELSRCFADFNPDEFDTLPDHVSEEDAREALQLLLKVVSQFPFKDDVARSAFLAHVLTETSRIAFDCSPVFIYSAPEAASGKTLLSKIASTIVHGTDPAVRTWPTTGDELRKVLYASLLAGDRAILFDNVPKGTKLRSAELCAFVTAPVWSDRKLGESKSTAIPNKIVVSGSGNNIQPVSDLARRSLVIRLNANMDAKALRKRTFEIPDLPGYLRENRIQLLMAALTIIRGRAQSEYVGPTPLPSFIGWSRLVRDALLWLGQPDCCEQDEETDDESDSLGDVFALLAPKLEDKHFTPGDVAKLVLTDFGDGRLADALRNGGCSDPTDPQKLGYVLRESKDRIAGGYQLRFAHKSTTSHASKRYYFVRTENAVDPNADLIGGEV